MCQIQLLLQCTYAAPTYLEYGAHAHAGISLPPQQLSTIRVLCVRLDLCVRAFAAARAIGQQEEASKL